MGNQRLARYGAASGIVFVILLVVGFYLVVPHPPNIDASAQTVGAYYIAHKGGIRLSLLLVALSLFFYLWFLGSLTSALRRQDEDSELPNVAFAGGLVGAAFIFLGITAGATAAFRPGDTSAELTRSLSDLALIAGAPAFAGFTVLFLATAMVILRGYALPGWLGLTCLAGAVVQPLTLGVMFKQTGVLAANGVFGLLLPFIGLVVPIAALSWVLAQDVPPTPPPRRRASAGGGGSRAKAATSGTRKPTTTQRKPPPPRRRKTVAGA